MKKTLWMLGAAVAALTSCTENEVLDVAESKMIQFDTFVGKSTRAAVPINGAQSSAAIAMDNLFQFWVYGIKDKTSLFDGTDANAKVYYSPSLGGFTYDNHKIWDYGSTYSFAAYSNGNTPLGQTLNDPKPENTPVNSVPTSAVKYEEIMDTDGSTPVGSKLTFIDYKVGDYDLLAAIAPTATLQQNQTQVGAVPFYFQHMLACVNIHLYNNTEQEYMQIEDIIFSNAIISTDCVYSIDKSDQKSVVWGDVASTGSTQTTGTYTFVGTEVNDNPDSPSQDDDDYLAPGQILTLRYFVIPQNNQNFSSTLTIRTYKKDNGIYEKASNAGVTKNISLAISASGHQTWQPGYLYNYEGVLNGVAEYIHFNVKSVEDWADKEYDVNSGGTSIVH